MAELLGGTPPVRAEVSGPRLWTVILSGLAAMGAAFCAPGLSPIWATAWLVLLASQVRFRVTGGGTPPISSRELSEWAAFYRLEPWGTEVEDWRAALITAAVANSYRDPKRRRKPYEPKDFMPQYEAPEAEAQTVEEQARILEMWARLLGSKSE